MGWARPWTSRAWPSGARCWPPIHHPDPAHLHLTGTGPHPSRVSASTRDAMHAKANADDATDSMKMFRMGLEDGQARRACPACSPSGSTRATASCRGRPGRAAGLARPSRSTAARSPRSPGIYVIGEDGAPARVGWALANEFSDHVTERINYLFLAHSKLRPACFGPEILVGDLPADIRGHLAASGAAAR